MSEEFKVTVPVLKEANRTSYTYLVFIDPFLPAEDNLVTADVWVMDSEGQPDRVVGTLIQKSWNGRDRYFVKGDADENLHITAREAAQWIVKRLPVPAAS